LLHELSADLLINPRTPSPPRIAPLLDKIAAALARPFAGTPDEIRAQEADAIADPTYEAYDISNRLVWEGQALPDADLAAAGGPINEGLNYLRNFAMFHAPARFDTDVRKLSTVAKKFFDLAHRASDAMTQMPATTEQFAVFEALYEALAQAEPEIPAAHALFVALQPLEAALASRRKPNTYATACQAPLEAFLTGLDTVVNRGPWGTNSWFPMISQPLREGIGWLIAKGTTGAGETPMGAYEYQRSADPPEDAKATAALAERHDEILHPRAAP